VCNRVCDWLAGAGVGLRRIILVLPVIMIIRRISSVRTGHATAGGAITTPPAVGAYQ
jgi:hypothetical protein